MATITYCHFDTAKGLAREIYEDIVRTYGIEEPHGIYQLMGHTPTFLSASWQRSRYLYGTAPSDTNVSLSRLPLKDKHLVTLAISATNNCDYCVRLHTARLEQLGMTSAQLLELLMIVDVVNGADKFAEGVRLGDNSVIPSVRFEPLDANGSKQSDQSSSSHPSLEAIQELQEYVPEYAAASAERTRRCFREEGTLGLKTKHMIAYGIAATNSNDFYVAVHLHHLKRAGMVDEDLVELLQVIDLACGYNRYVQGLQIQPGERAFVPSHERKPFATPCS